MKIEQIIEEIEYNIKTYQEALFRLEYMLDIGSVKDKMKLEYRKGNLQGQINTYQEKLKKLKNIE